MSEKVADFVLGRLRDWGVEQVFTFPEDGINGILVACGWADNHPKFVQARHEEMSAFEAVGYAKFSSKAGVCMATSGPDDAGVDKCAEILNAGECATLLTVGSSFPYTQAKAMLAGDGDARGVIRTGVKQKLQELLPGEKK